MIPYRNEWVLSFYDDDEEFGHLVTYEEGHNDPPPELEPKVWQWLQENCPGWHERYQNSMKITIVFPTQEARVAFKHRWSRYAHE